MVFEQIRYPAAFSLRLPRPAMMNHATTASTDWRTYFVRVGPRLVLFARQWLPDPADAEDAVQEAFIRFWRKHSQPDEQHTGLLFAAVRHAALDHLRAERRRRVRETASAQQPTNDAWFAPAVGDEGPAIQTALQELAAEQREVLVLKIWGELTFAQISEALGASPNTVASRYRYAINHLRKTFRSVCHG